MSILVNYLSVHSLDDDMDREASLPLLVLHKLFGLADVELQVVCRCAIQ